jgi:hypothetical protein
VRAVRGGQSRLLGHLFIGSPNQASNWETGDTMPIRWDTKEIPGNVRISLSREGGKPGTFDLISETPNDGEFDWMIQGNGSVNCMLKIEPVNAPDKFTQQGLFMITDFVPQNLTSNSHTINICNEDRTIDIEWTAPEVWGRKIDGYSVQWDHSPHTLLGKTITTTDLNHTSHDLTKGNDHFVHIRVVDDQGHWSQVAAHLGPFCIGSIDNPKPEGLQINDVQSQRIALVWNDTGEGLTYIVYKSNTQNGNFVQCNSANHTEPVFVDTDLVEETQYWYKIQSVNASGNVSPFSDVVTAITLSKPTDVQKPEGLRINDTQLQQIDLSWYYMGKDLKYNVYKSDSETGFFIKCDPYEITEPEFVDTDVIEGIQYWYKVKAVNASGEESLFSDAVSAKIEPVEGGSFQLKSLHPHQMQINGLQAIFDIQAETKGGYADDISLNVVDLHPWMESSFNRTRISTPNYFARLTVYVNNAPPGKYTFYISGVGKNRDNKMPLFLDVINPQDNASAISAYINSASTQINKTVEIYGKIFPMGFNAPLNVYIQHESDDQPVIKNAISDKTKSYQITFIPPKTGRYTIYSKWDGNQTFEPAQSPSLELIALRGKSKLTCYTLDEEISDDDMVLIKGELALPRIENAHIILKIQPPDEPLKWIKHRILTDANGRFAYSIPLNRPGIWEISSCWEGNEQYVGSVSPPLRLYPGLKAGKALIVAGGGLVDNNLWVATKYLTRKFYKILLRKNYSQEMIHYLSPDTEHNDDQIAINDNTPAVSDIKEYIQSLYQDASQPDVNTDRPFLIYLVDHGGIGQFKVNHGGEILYAQDLDKWLDDLQIHTDCKVYVIIEACHSGSFIDVLASTSDDQKRVIITSSGQYEKSHLSTRGDISFSQLLFNEFGNAANLYESFQNATAKMRIHDDFKTQNQNPQLFDGKAGELAKTIYIGSKLLIADSLPEFGEDHTPSKTLSAGAHELYAHIYDLEGIDSAWAYIMPPNFYIPEPTDAFETPIIDLPRLNLIDGQGNGRYSGIYDHFTQNGTYQVTFYCEDTDGNVVSSEKISLNVIDGYTPGDLDNNGKVNLSDAIISMKSNAGMTVSVADNARILCNGVIGACEVVEILQIMAGMK